MCGVAVRKGICFLSKPTNPMQRVVQNQRESINMIIIHITAFRQWQSTVGENPSGDIGNRVVDEWNLAIISQLPTAVRPIFHNRDSNDRNGA